METITRRAMVMRAFSPSAPIASKALFAGRHEQMSELINIAYQSGQHAVIYGERGVGKTSLARVMKEVFDTPNSWTSYYTCSSGDTFASIWRGVLSDFPMTEERVHAGFASGTSIKVKSLADLLNDSDPTPNEVRRALELLGEADGTAVIFIDEFDRPVDSATRAQFADMIKILSDQVAPITLVLVGVADDIDELISEHASIQRALVQIQMPRMTRDELIEIISQGMRSANLSFHRKFAERVVRISQGLPHYTHLLAQHAGVNAVMNEREKVLEGDFETAVKSALSSVSQTVREKYHRATYSNRETLYKQVLLACAMVEKDDLGTFGAPDVRDKLSDVTGRRYEIPSFANHLTDFSSLDGPRGGILAKRGTQRRFRYRFIDPLMPPFILMKGSAEGLVSGVT
ncbi:nSTAND1 domain-containing NTPase [Streptomyces phaeochromogenes]|uniref:nSTAND1 domain-containing NTPase n=1 Tax=Streptomyces phaeochromogenes TaxID=1923 RepID=UPI00371B0B7B